MLKNQKNKYMNSIKLRYNLALALILSSININAFAVVNTPLSCINNTKSTRLCSDIGNIESSHHSRIGVYAIDTSNNSVISYNGMQKFPFCSTSKIMVAAAILKQSENNQKTLSQVIKYSESDVINSGYAPVTSKNINHGMTIKQLYEVALEYSDNTAMNLLIDNLGGITMVNKFTQSIGDNEFHLDRNEPLLNSAIPGDERDTTTPKAMTISLQKLLLGSVLESREKELLLKSMINNTTGNTKIRAGVVYPDWVVGDKTGGGGYGASNDIGIIYPKNCAPIILSIYTTRDTKDAIPQTDIIAKITKLIIQDFSKNNICLDKNRSNSK